MSFTGSYTQAEPIETETHVLFYGLKHSVAAESIVSGVEAVLSRQRNLSESAKNNIRSRIASTVQSASIEVLYGSHVTFQEQ